MNANDPKLTAYVLGELNDTERLAVEAALEQSDHLRRAVAEIRATTELLTTELAAASAPGLTTAQRKMIEQSATPTVRARLTRSATSGARTILIPAALAASVAIAAGAVWMATSLREPAARQLVAFNMKGIGTSRHLYDTGDSSGGGTVAYSLQFADAFHASDEVAAFLADAQGSLEPRVPAQIDSMKEARSRQVERNVRRKVRGAPGKRSVKRPRTRAGKSAETSAPVSLTVSVDSTASQTSGTSIFGGAIAQYDERAVGPDGWGVPVHPDQYGGRTGDYAFVPPPGRPSVASTLMEGEPVVIEGRRIDYDFARLIHPEGPPAGESYQQLPPNPFLTVEHRPLSTFSIDVDTASYANVRRFLNQGRLPMPGSVRIEELINYFDYDYPQPTGDDPFSVNVEVAQCPWHADHRLARIGIKGQEMHPDERPETNLVFLIDVSGSMASPHKLTLLQESLGLLVDELTEYDSVAIVVYAGASGLVLPATPCDDKNTIHAALYALHAGGSTNGGAGIELAYDVAEENFIDGGVNRVILATDGDFNVGVSDRNELAELIEEKAAAGVFLTVLGFGMGNLNDATLETLADKGNGNYAYIDTIAEAEKVLVDQLTGTLVTIAKDVKIQVEFNPAEVAAYRLIGYENRMLAAKDFNDDTKDAGEIGAGHTVTAIYEIIPAGQDADQPEAEESDESDQSDEADGSDQSDRPDVPDIDELKYQTPGDPTEAAFSGELMTVKLRYKEPAGDVSKLIELPVTDGGATLDEASDDFAFAAAVAGFGMLLRHEKDCGDLNFADVMDLADTATREDRFGYRAEFIELVEQAARLRTP